MSQFRRIKDLTGLTNLSKGLGAKYKVQVGIFGGKGSRKGGALTNADVGAIHEFGSFSRGIPARSFLRMPIRFKTARIMKEAGKKFLELFSAHRKNIFWESLGIAAEGVIQEAFSTGGYGKWPKLAAATAKRKGSDAILIVTAQLRRSIASRVKAA